MKITKSKLVSTLLLSFIFVSAATVSAKETKSVHQALSTVSAPELPSKAAQLVIKASGAEQEDVTISVVKTAIALRPASAAAVVGAIARVAPHRASLAAKTAIALLPKQAAQINKASLSGASQKSIGTAKGSPQNAVGPTVGPPFVPVPFGTPEVTPGDTTPVPPGGRDYSAP